MADWFKVWGWDPNRANWSTSQCGKQTLAWDCTLQLLLHWDNESLATEQPSCLSAQSKLIRNGTTEADSQREKVWEALWYEGKDRKRTKPHNRVWGLAFLKPLLRRPSLSGCRDFLLGLQQFESFMLNLCSPSASLPSVPFFLEQRSEEGCWTLPLFSSGFTFSSRLFPLSLLSPMVTSSFLPRFFPSLCLLSPVPSPYTPAFL